jgi:hypothetical protein
MVERVGEALARRIDRRLTAKKAAGFLFAWTAAWATQGPFGPSALANECQAVTEYDCTCNFPFGREGRQLYCNKKNPNNCDGAQCGGNCQYNYDYYESTACWCSKECKHGKGQYGYYKCCDCKCPSAANDVNPEGQCGCRRFYRTR